GVIATSSISLLASVITASVVNGKISETAPTNVVLPTPNPPATTIFVEVGTPSRLEPAKSTEHPFQQSEVRLARLKLRLVHLKQPFGRHVGDQDPGHTEGDPEQRRDLGHRAHLHAQVA